MSPLPHEDRGCSRNEGNAADVPAAGRRVPHPPPERPRRPHQAAGIDGADQPRRGPALPEHAPHGDPVRALPGGHRDRDRVPALLHRRPVQPAQPRPRRDPEQGVQPPPHPGDLRAQVVPHCRTAASASPRCCTPTTSIPGTDSSRVSTLPRGRRIRRNPSLAASPIRRAAWLTARTSPPSPTSPTMTVAGSTGLSRWLLATAHAIPRSAAGSSTWTPPATFT